MNYERGRRLRGENEKKGNKHAWNCRWSTRLAKMGEFVGTDWWWSLFKEAADSRRAATAAHDFHNVHFGGGIFGAWKRWPKITLRFWFQATEYCGINSFCNLSLSPLFHDLTFSFFSLLKALFTKRIFIVQTNLPYLLFLFVLKVSVFGVYI